MPYAGSARMKMDCQGDPARIETFRVAIPVEAGKVAGSGRFITRAKASGTFGGSDASTGCYVGGVKWTASLL